MHLVMELLIAVTVNATGGSSPYSYQWNDILAQTTATASGLLCWYI